MTHIRMTDNEIRTLWRNRGLSDRQMVTCIAELNGCGRPETLNKLVELGLVDPSKFSQWREERAYTEEELRRFSEMLRAHCSYEVIRKRLGRSMASVTNKARELKQKGV